MATLDSSTVSGRVAAALHDYRCATCGYGVAVARPPESCPMCQSKVWGAGIRWVGAVAYGLERGSREDVWG